MTKLNQSQPESIRPLSGKTAWLITDGAQGLITQTRGLADELGLISREITVKPRGIWKTLAPWAPVDPREGFASTKSQFHPPWPDVAIASGRLSVPYIRALRRHTGFKTYTVILQDPKTAANTADLIWVPQHDKRRGINVIHTPTAPHGFSQKRLRTLRQYMPESIAKLPGPRVAIILGGKNKVYRFEPIDDEKFSRSIRSMSALGASFLITPSRRTHPELLELIDKVTQDQPRLFWDGTGENPYPQFLAHADYFIATADSTNMCGEVCATGRPVYVFTPSGGSAKFQRFHDNLTNLGATRPLPEHFTSFEPWSYQPIDSTREIANAIEQRYARRHATISGDITKRRLWVE